MQRHLTYIRTRLYCPHICPADRLQIGALYRNCRGWTQLIALVDLTKWRLVLLKDFDNRSAKEKLLDMAKVAEEEDHQLAAALMKYHASRRGRPPGQMTSMGLRQITDTARGVLVNDMKFAKPLIEL